jgi:hypothetical protein
MIFVKPRVLKELDTEIVPILALIFQISRESGVVPSDWKTAHVDKFKLIIHNICLGNGVSD